jgi:hypothetical protein
MGASYPVPESVYQTIRRSLDKSTLSYCKEPMHGVPWALDGLQNWGTSLAGLIENIGPSPGMDEKEALKAYGLHEAFARLQNEFSGLIELAMITLAHDPVVREWIDAARESETE